MNSNTPETDAELSHYVANYDKYAEVVDFARKLEQERDEARKHSWNDMVCLNHTDLNSTPRIDAKERCINYPVFPFEKFYYVESEFARQLEQELNLLEAKLTALGSLAVSHWDDKVVGEVDSILSPEKQAKYSDLLRYLFVEIPKERDEANKSCERLATGYNKIETERDQLRKVCDEYKAGFIASADNFYNQLPHVKNK